MAKDCSECHQSYADYHDRCPHCASGVAQAAGVNKGAHAGQAPISASVAEDKNTSSQDMSDAQVDLGQTDARGDQGPPSGASFVSWTSALKTSKKSKAITIGQSSRGMDQDSDSNNLPASVPPLPVHRWVRAGGIGIFLGCLLSFTYWATGGEPLHTLRTVIGQWLGLD